MAQNIQDGGPHTQPSLPSLPSHLQGDVHLTAHLASRFHVSLPTAQLSSHALISFNTYTTSTKGPNGRKEGSAMAGAEEVADRAWTRLGARSENQAVVFLGESGSGKTTVRSHLLSAILAKSSTPLSTKLSLAAYLFDTLTTTKTATTATASKAGLFFELQYDTSTSVNPTLIGGKVLNHRLERSRVTAVPPGERSYHVLYYLLAGTSAAEKQHLGLDLNVGLKKWRYLGHPSQMKVGINDAQGFQLFKTALRKLEFPKSEIAEICQVLASILHLGQLEFETALDTNATGDDSGGYSHEGAESVTTVKNKDALVIVAAFLGVSVQDLQTTLGYKTKILQRERVTVMLDPQGAKENADELARTMYSLLVAYIIESVNQRVCALDDTVGNTISIVDFPGFQQQSATGSTLDQLLTNAATEALYNFSLQSFFERSTDLLEQEEVSVAATSYYDNSDAVKGLLRHGNGILSVLDDQSRRIRTDIQFLESLRKRFDPNGKGKNPAIDISASMAKLPGSNFSTRNMAAAFTVKHFAGEVVYPVAGLVEENGEVVSGDLMNLIAKTKSDFVRELFGQEALNTVVHPQEKTTIMQAQVSSKPLRKPSVMRKKGERPSRFGSQRIVNQRQNSNSPPASEVGDMETLGKKGRDISQGAAGQFLSALDNVTKSLTAPNTNPYFVFCLKPNDRRLANQFDSKCVRTQMQTFGIPEISQRLRNADFSIFLPFGEFLGMAAGESIIVGSEREKTEMVLDEKRWPGNEAKIGTTGVFLSERCWAEIANLSERGFVVGRYHAPLDDAGNDGLLTPNKEQSAGFDASKENLLSGNGLTPSPFTDDKKIPGYFGGRDFDSRSEAGASAFGQGDMFRNLDTQSQLAEKGNEKTMVEVEEVAINKSRKRWVAIVWLMTWLIPDFAVRFIGRMPRKDVRQAWREKLAINMMIWWSCAITIFIIVIMPKLICPTQHVYSTSELASHDGTGGSNSYVAIRGQVLDLGSFEPHHWPGSDIIPTKYLTKYAGTDATSLFPVQVHALCGGVNGTLSPEVQLDFTNTSTVTFAQYHNFNYYTNDSRPDWYYEQMELLKASYKKGLVGYSPTYLKTLAKKGQSIASIDGTVYDFTDYNAGGRGLKAPVGKNVTATSTDFMDSSVVELFTQRSGQDVSKYWHALDISDEMRSRMQTCMTNLFFAGAVDTRDSVKCQFSTYFILAVSLAMVSVIGFKFFAALQFGKKNIPENLDKFVICQVPAYTEDEDSLRRAIDSLARMKYDDKRKLMVIVCDGMIIGQGNDRPTPRIVLDILGVADTVDPEPLSFESLGEGQKQHNMGKVYSGLYEVSGHIVPFLVVVKVGKPSEVSRPGNRGKRDSQMIMMRFLNRVAYNLPMTPLELEMYHQIRNVIGVNPQFYEFILQVDADTVVANDSASRMVSAFVDDTRLIGVCGETSLSNARISIVTMMQVYEYWISHNLIKAFESLFGSVTCLPGCFTMYRIRDAASNKPLFVSREVIDGYSNIRVDTLHMKNLLHLGEDRYLTTLLLKHHAKYKTKYIFGAHAWTIAPDTFSIFMSQRRRWINSTVHNLAELIPMQQLCGFCCFSMRFIVFIDLLSTIIQPVTFAYIVYLIWLVASGDQGIPLTAFILLGAIYGLQAIIFILRRKWEMIGWMIVYILAIPLFSFYLPLYSFWHMDDFSWGNTRVVTGEKGKKVVITDEGKFDPASIPHKKWDEYAQEMEAYWEAQTQRDDRSEISGYSYATKSYHAAQSEYGFPPSRPMSIRETSYSPGPNYPYDSKSAAVGYNSRISLAPSEMGMLGGNNAQHRNSMLGSQYFGNNNDLELSNLGGPTDDELLAEIRNILASNQLINVTKKSLRMELERRFGVSLDARKAFINSATEAMLKNQL